MGWGGNGYGGGGGNGYGGEMTKGKNFMGGEMAKIVWGGNGYGGEMTRHRYFLFSVIRQSKVTLDF